MTSNGENDNKLVTRQWLQANQSKLPMLMKEHLQWVADHTNNFETAPLETPPTMKYFGEMLKKGRANNHRRNGTSTAAAKMRKPTMLPISNPLTTEKLEAVLEQEEMSLDDLNTLCEAVQGYHPGATKAPLENWLFDSFLSSAEEIIPNLYLGGVATAHDKTKLLDQMGITRVVCVGGRAFSMGADIKYEPPFSDQITYKIIDVDDTEKEADVDALGACFTDAVEFINEGLNRGDRVLIHCMAGVSRSASVTCSYLIWKYGLTVDEAIELVRSARPVATPNAAFRTQLEAWHAKNNVQQSTSS